MPRALTPKVQSEPQEFYSPGAPVPPLSAIPRPPKGFGKPAPRLRGVKPRTSELNLISKAVAELRAFDDYEKVFGVTAPERTALLATLERAENWSAMRVALADWDAFCAFQEGAAWKDSRKQLSRLGPAFELATIANPKLADQHFHLSMLVTAMKAIVRKGVATKKANRQAVLEGREPLRGKALRAARKAAEKAALVEQQKKSAPAVKGAKPKAGR